MKKTISSIVKVINHFDEQTYQAADFATLDKAWEELEKVAEETGHTAEQLYSQYYEGL